MVFSGYELQKGRIRINARGFREELRLRYRPSQVRLLFVGESPPANGTFFYLGNSNLWRYTHEAFRNVYGTDFDHDNSFCEFFVSKGCYLEDLCLAPVNRMKKTERRQPDVLTISTEGKPYSSQVITCDLELPLEPALYAVTIRLVRNDGYIDSRWVTYEKSGHNPIQAGWADILKEQCWDGNRIELVTCPDVGGYVALVRANPVGVTHFENTGMRKVTSRFSLSFYPFAQLTTTPLDDQVFGGITITRI